MNLARHSPAAMPTGPWRRPFKATAALTLATVLLSACGGAPAGSSSGTDLVTFDPVSMADQACHYMDGKVMGKCSPEEIETVKGDALIIDKVSMADRPCHVMDGKIMGQCSDADTLRFKRGVIVVDTERTKDQPCTSNGFTITGNCSQAEIDRLATELRGRRDASQ